MKPSTSSEIAKITGALSLLSVTASLLCFVCYEYFNSTSGLLFLGIFFFVFSAIVLAVTSLVKSMTWQGWIGLFLALGLAFCYVWLNFQMETGMKVQHNSSLSAQADTKAN